MKNLKKFLILLASAAIVLPGVVSCDDDDLYDDYYSGSGWTPDAIVTVRTTSDNVPYFQLDNETTLEPVDWQNPYKTVTRAFVKYTELSSVSSFCTRQVELEQIDTILPKGVVVVPASTIASSEAMDPLEIVGDWMTSCEDGFLTVHFTTQWGLDGITHLINLWVDQADPYTFWLRHDKNGDYGTYWMEGIAAFSLEDVLPDPGDEGIEITLRWISFSGEQSTTFTYKIPQR